MTGYAVRSRNVTEKKLLPLIIVREEMYKVRTVHIRILGWILL